VFHAVSEALKIGYRHVDTAMAYENEAAVGRAIETSTVNREDVFVTAKIKGYPEFLTYDRMIEAVEGSLQRLETDRIDLVLIHWWHPDGEMEEVFGALSQLVDDGKIDHIGVSNFSIEQLDRAVDASDAPIATNQVQYHLYFREDEMLSFCCDHDVLLTAYSPLAAGLVTDDETLLGMGDSTGNRPHRSLSGGSSNRTVWSRSRRRCGRTASARILTCSTSNSRTSRWGRSTGSRDRSGTD